MGGILCARRFEHERQERWCLLTVELGDNGRCKLISRAGKAAEAWGSKRIVAESRSLKAAMENLERASQRAISAGHEMTDDAPLAAELAATLQAGASDWVDDSPTPVRLAGGGQVTPNRVLMGR